MTSNTFARNVKMAVQAVICVVIAGCSKADKASYGLALAEARQTIPFAAQFDALFPDCIAVLERYTGQTGPTELNMATSLHERYVFSMEILVTLDKTRRRVIKHGQPIFQIVEIEEIDGRSILYDSSFQKGFSLDQWKILVDSNGDFKSIGIELEQNSSIPGFADMWRKQPTAF